MKVVIAGGGTAGHVNPALAVAQAMSDDSVSFIGTAVGAESTLVPGRGFELNYIDVAGFDRAKPLLLPAVGIRAVKAFRAARSILTARSPDVVLGMGGYVSLPVVTAARSARIPVVLHEQNIVLGLANRLAKRAARTVAVSFEETLSDIGAKGVFTGNPVLPEIVSAELGPARERGIERWRLDPWRKTLLVFGGSLGAATINAAARGLAKLWSHRADVQVVHVTGMRNPAEVGSGGDLIYRSESFVTDMVEAYAVADIALCRGGATTVAELGVIGLPSVIVPYPHHRDKQQERHGRVLEAAGAAAVIPDAEATADRVATVVDDLWSDEDRLGEMRNAAKRWGRPDAAAALAAVVRSAA
ncbi:MAG: undecaprenyldiphospho-muramoylpentapeptide beta-N-acetylglucosaminyltransferase [Actinomycetota bacterium]|nr:undecaprenyldiphospho-muramoylpentapeptide beta-N-acetylglucosaminyltransferase [Actinomycetota bacterium]